MLLLKSINNTAFSFAVGDQWRADSTDYVMISSTGASAIATAQINGTWASAEIAPLSISSPWNTSPTNYIKIYTGTGAVNTGIWSTSAYRLVVRVTTSNTYALNIAENYVQVTGLQIGLTNNSGTNVTGCSAVNISSLTGVSLITLQKNIINGTLSGTGNTGTGITSADNDSLAVINLYNNIVYGFVNGSTASSGISVGGSLGGTYNVDNNTCYGNYYGIVRVAGTANLKNNLCVSNTGGDYSGTFNAPAAVNADYSDDATSPDGSTDQGKSVTFVSAGSDFHLASTDTSGAATAGVDLTTTFTDDVQGIMRGTGTGVWSVGASQSGDTWTDNNGTGDNNWFTAANWSSGSVPGSGSAAIFNSAYNYACNISGTVSIKSIDILNGYTQAITLSSTVTLSGFSQASGTFNASGVSSMAVNNFTQTGGTFTAPTNLSVSGNWTQNSGTFTPGSGTVTFNGTGAQAMNASAAAKTFYNLATSGTSVLTIGGSITTLTLSGLTIGSGTWLNAGTAANINVAGTWTNSGGTFFPGTGTVTLNGAGQSITGSNTFYNLTKTVSTADTLTFAASSTQTISAGGTLTLSGASGQLLALRSSTTNTQYNITLSPNSSSLVSYCDVEDSNASGYTITAGYSVDSGDNTNWVFNSGSITAVKVWTGATSSAWATSTNWQMQNGAAATVPISTDAVLINGAYTNAPVISAPVTIGSLIMSGASTLTMQYSGTNPNLTVTGNVNMSGTSNLTHAGGSTTASGELYKLNMSVAGNFTLGSTATINVTGSGYNVGNGPGVGSGAGSGGGYGGIGGPWNVNGISSTYGSITAPVNLGSGAGSVNSGGGAVILSIAGAFTDNGAISANGNIGGNGASGSGGSVYITTGTISGTGAISANGGVGGVGGGGAAGGGGRIAIILTSSGATFSGYSGTVTAYGAGLQTTGAAGTVYEQTQAQSAGVGTLIINNNNAYAGVQYGYRITTLMPSASSVGSSGAVNLSNFSNIIITGDGVLGLNSDTTINFGTATINSTTGSGTTFTAPTIASTTANAFITLYASTSPLLAVNTTNVVFPSAYAMNNYTLNIDGPLSTTPSGSTWVISGTGVLSHDPNYTNAMSEMYKLNLTVTGNLTLGSTVSMNVNGDGYALQNGPGGNSGGDAGASYGGIGSLYPGVTPPPTYGSITAPVNLGSGGDGYSGGGAVILNISGAFTDNSTISANGNGGDYGCGSGGSIYITTGTISGTGAISANGGTQNIYGSGGGGRIAIILTSSGATFSGYSVTPTAYGGAGGAGGYAIAAAGTIYEQIGTQSTGTGTLIINDNGNAAGVQNGYRITTLMPTGTNLNNFSNIIITGSGVLGVNTDTTINFGTNTINSTTGSGTTFTSVTPASIPTNSFITCYGYTNVTFPSALNMNNYTLNLDEPLTISGSWALAGTGALAHSANGSTAQGEMYKLNLTVTGSLTLGVGVSINVNGNGYAASNGPGVCGGNCGGGYGGMGGIYGAGNTPGPTYGSITAPVNLGSGAGNGPGGGAVILSISGAFTNNGTISANGGASGSGGSVYITTGTISGAGAISANGKNGNQSAGGGGRVAIILNSLGATFPSGYVPPNVTAYGGSSNGDGAAGTIYEQTQAQGAGGGTLIIDNNNTTTGIENGYNIVTDISSSLAVGAMTLQNTGNFTIDGGTGASATASVTSGVVTSVTLVSGGSGYTAAAYPVTFSGGGGSGAFARANVTAGAISTITVLGGGSSYTSAPAVIIAGAGALTTQGTVTININSTLTNNGTLAATGSWVQTGGFAAGTATLTGPSTISGMNIASGTLTFSPGYTYTVATGSTPPGITLASGAAINFNGTSYGSLVSLVSSSPGISWYYANASGSSTTANYVNVQDSTATTSVAAASSINSGNNVNWTFSGGNTRLWKGTSGSNWGTAANWSGNTVPLSTDTVVFDGTNYNNPCSINVTAVAGNIVVNSSYTSTITNSNNTLSVSGNWTQNGGTFTSGTGSIVNFNGGTSQTFNGSTASETFYNLTIGSGTTLSAGTVTNINVAGNWTNNGTFTPGTGTVTLNGTGQSILGTGSNTFYNLTKTVTTTDTLTFAASSTQTIATNGTLTLNGASGQLLALRSSSSGTQYNITLGTNTSSAVSYVDVKDSNASSGYAIPASNSVDSGNNLNWMINSGVITNVKVWNGSSSTAWATNGNWQLQNGTVCNGTNCTAPISTDGVVISANGTHAPLISAGPVTIASLVMSGASTLTMQYSGTNPNLIVTGNVIMSGTSNLTHTGGSTGTTELYKLNMSVAGNFNLASTATINVTGDGYAAVNGPGYGTGTYSGGSYGGIGGVYTNSTPGLTYGSITAPVNLGSGGTFYSSGGAVILSIAGAFTDSGTISANGNVGGNGGGSGGSVYISTGTISGTGTISANGGSGTGSGGGGRIAIILTSTGATFSGYSGTVTAYGGNTGTSGAAGTVYEQTPAQGAGAGTLIINNNNVIAGTQAGYRITTLMPSAGSVGSSGAVNLNNFSNIIITGNGNLQLNSDTMINFGTATINSTTGSGSTFTNVTPASTTLNSFITLYASTSPLLAVNTTNVVFPSAFAMNNYTLNIDGPLTITGNWTLSGTGVLSHDPNSTSAMAEMYKLNLTVTGNLTLGSTVSMNVNGDGYAAVNGPGIGTGSNYGGSYGGMGGVNSSGTPGPTYGSIIVPVNLGSGGHLYYSGGGAVILSIAGAFTDNGTISANGGGGAANNYSGSGGSVYITTGTISGAGAISANGGYGGDGGGGGRVAIILTSSGATFSGFPTPTAYGGGSNSALPGAAGTVYEQTLAQGPGGGTLIIDNSNTTTGIENGYNIVTDISSSLAVGAMTLQNKGNLTIDGGTGASATASVTTGAVTSVTFVGGGSGYTASYYPVTFSGGGGSGAFAVANVTSGAISSITLLGGGSGYITAPTVIIGGAGNLTTSGPVTINTGSTLTNKGTLAATGSWTQTGTFAAGTTAALSGPSTITGLNIASGTLTLNGGYTYTINDGSLASGLGITVASGAAINFNGTSYDALVTLVSSSPGTSWYYNNVSGSSTTANYVNVQDSTATTSVSTLNSINSGNNVLWTFGTNTRLWKGTTSSAWGTASNWSGNTVPSSTDIVTFDGSYNNPCSINVTAVAGQIVANSSYTSTISLNANTLTVSGSADFTGGTLNAGTGTLVFSGGSSPTWTMAGKTYYNVTIGNVLSGNYTLSGTGTISHILTLNTVSTINGGTINLTGIGTGANSALVCTNSAGGTTTINMAATGAQNIIGTAGTIPGASPGALTISANSNTTISGAASLQTVTDNGTLNFNPGTYTITAGDTITVNSTATLNFIGTGLSFGNMVYLTASGNWIFNNVGTVNAAYVDVEYSQAVSPIYPTNSVDAGNNTNWNFGSTGGVLWLGTSGNNWSTAANWSSGSVPSSTQTALFNAQYQANCTVNQAVSFSGSILVDTGYIGTITMNNSLTTGSLSLNGTSATFNSNGQTLSLGAYAQLAGTFTGGASTINIGTFNQSGGTCSLGSGPIAISGNFTLSGGMFTSTSATLSFAGSIWAVGSRGAFNPNSGTVNFTASAAQTVPMRLGQVMFYNLIHSGSGTLTLSPPPAYNFSYYKAITINSSHVSGGQTNFPVLITISSDSNLAGNAQASGNDIIFTDSNGDQLSHEIEKYVSSTGELWAWVKVPVLSSSANTVIYMYYGNSSSPNQQNVSDVWSNGYTGVWHLDSNASLSLADSTSNAINLLVNNNGVTLGAGNIADGAGYFVNGAGSYFAVNNSAATINSLPSGSGARTMEAWFKLGTASPSGYLGGFGSSGSGNTSNAFSLSGSTIALNYGSDAPQISWAPDFNWHYLVQTLDTNLATTSTQIYLDGASKSVTGGSGILAATASPAYFYIGDFTGQSAFSGGWINEFRISNVARSSGWIATEYNNVNNPGTFYSLGTDIGTNGNANLLAGGNFTNSGGAFILNNQNIAVAGNFNTTGATFTPGTGTVIFNGTSSTQAVTSAGQSFYGLTVNTSGSTVSFADNPTITNALTLSAGTLNANSTLITATGAALSLGQGTFNCSPAGASLTASSATLNNIVLASGALTINPGTYTITPTDTISVANGATLNFTGTSASAPVILTSGGIWFVTENGTVNATYVAVDHSTVNNSQTITANSSADNGNNTGWNFGSNSLKYWIRPASSGAGNFSDATNWTGNSVPTAFNIVVFDNAGTANCNFTAPVTVAGFNVLSGYTGIIFLGTNNLTVNGDFNLAAGTLNGGSSTTIAVSGNANFTGGSFSAGTSTLSLPGTSSGKIWTLGSQTYNNVSIGGSNSLTLSGSGNAAGLTLNTTGSLSGTTSTITLSGPTLTGTACNGGSVVINWTGAPSSWAPGSAVYPYLKFNTTATTTALSAGLTANSLEIASGALNGNTQSITINGTTGSFIVSAAAANSFTAGANGTLTFSSATTSPSWTQSSSNAATYANVIDNDSTALSVSSGVTYTLSGSLTLNSGSSLNNNGTLNVSGNLIVSGAAAGTALVNLNNTSGPQTITASSATLPLLALSNTAQIATLTSTGTATLQNITLNSGSTLTFNPGAYTITQGDTMTVASGATLNFSGINDTTGLVVLRSSNTGSPWYVNNAGGSTVTPVFTDVEDSHATNNINTTSCINSSGNANWTFPAAAFSSWSLDMNAKTVTLNFTDSVKVSTLSVPQITLLNADGSAAYTLASSTSTSIDGKAIVINLSITDFNAITDTSGLCSSLSNSYITLTSSAIKGLNNNYVSGVTEVQASSYTVNSVAASSFRITTASGASTVTATAGTALTGAVIKTYDNNGYRAISYTGNKSLLFSTIVGQSSPNGTAAQASSYTGIYQNFGADTTLNFSNGLATTNLELYCETASGAPAQVYVTEDNSNPITSINYDLMATVNPALKSALVFSVEPSAASIINAALTPQPQITIEDPYGNKTADTDAITFYASTSNTSYMQASGTLSANSNPVNAVNGVATPSGLNYNGLGTIYLEAQDPGVIPAFSNAITFSYASNSTVTAASSPVQNFNLNPVNDTLAQRFAVLAFKVKNAGGDGVATVIDQIKIAITGTGANASTDIAWAGLYKGANQIATATGAAITNTYITFGTAPGNGVTALDSVADGTSTAYTIYVYMKNTKLSATDTQTYIFDTNETLIGVDSAGNQMAGSTGSVLPVIGTVTVSMTYFDIVSQVSGMNSLNATAGTPVLVEIMATDVNRNIATSYGGAYGANETLVFSGLDNINGNVPKINNTQFGSNITLAFVNGVTSANSVNLTAYKSENVNLSVAQVGVSPAYTVYLCNLSVVSASAASIAYVSGNNQTAIIKNTIVNPLICLVLDAYGNPVSGQSVSFAVSSPPAGATGYSVSPASVNTDSNGHASTYLTIGNLGGVYVTQASSLDTNNNPLTGSPVSFNINATQPTALVQVSGNTPEQSTPVGTALTNPFVVELEDVHGVAVPGQPVTFSILTIPTNATGQVLSATSATTDVNGQASTTLTMGNISGAYTVIASYSGVTPSLSANFTALALASAPYKVVLSGPAAVNAGAASSAFTVSVEDVNNNLSGVNANTVFNLSTSNSGGTNGFYSDSACTQLITSVTVLSGTNTVQFYYKQSDATNITLTAAWVSGTLLNSSHGSSTMAVSILPAGVSYFIITGTGSTLTAGGSMVVAISAYDINNNLTTNYTGTLPVIFSGANTSSSGQAPTALGVGSQSVAFGSSTTLSFNAGVAASTIKLYKAESALIAVTAGSVTTSAVNSLAITVAHNTPDHLAFQGNVPGPQTAGVLFNFGTTLAGVDLYGNVCNSSGVVYSGAKTLSWALSGQANGPVSGTDSFVTAVSFSNGVSTTALSATLFRAQTTTLTATDGNLPGASAASNSIVVNAANINGMIFLQEPPGLVVVNNPFVPQPQVALADTYGNVSTNKSATITLAASLSGSGYIPTQNGTLLGTNLSLNTTNGVAVYSNVRYTYPETIYLRATAGSVTGGVTLPEIYSTAVSFSTAQELTVGLPIIPVASTMLSSIANTQAQAVNVLDFQITNGSDGLPGVISKIVIERNTDNDTSGGWTGYLSGAYISDGTTQYLGIITDNTITFGTGSSILYSVSNSTTKIFTLSVAVKTSLSAGADDKVMAFTMAPLSDITLLTPETNIFNTSFSPVISNSSTVSVIATKLVVTGNMTLMSAGITKPITVTAQDKNNNIDLEYNYPITGMSIIFSGADASTTGNAPTCTDYTGTAQNFGSPTYVQFTNGVSSSAINMTLYKAESVAIAASDGNGLTAASTADKLSLMVNGGTGTQLLWNIEPKNMIVANAVWNPFVIAVADSYGNTAAATNLVTTISTTAGITISPGASNQATSAGGLATFNNYALYSSTGSYPVTSLTLVASAGSGITPTPPSVPITLAQNYTINMTAEDSMTDAAMTGFSFTATDANGVTVVPTYVPALNPFSIQLPYGNYTFTFSVVHYVDLNSPSSANVPADAADGIYDNVIHWTEYMTSIVEANANYSIESNFAYNESAQTLSVRMWLTRLGKTIVNNGINNLAPTATITVIDPFGNSLTPITLQGPALTDTLAGDAFYQGTIPNVLSANNILGEALTPGGTYFANCVINYGGASGTTNTFQGGTQFTLTVTEALVNNVINAIGEPVGQTIAAQIEGAQSSITNAVTAAQTALTAQVSAVKSDTAQIATATQTTIPNQITAAQAVLTNAIISKVLNSETTIAQGKTLTIRYQTGIGLSPKIDVYGPKNVLRISKGAMQEIGATGVYSYPVTFQSSWGLGDCAIVCSEATKGTVDSYTVTITASDIDQVNSNVSAVLGSTTGLNGIGQAAASLNSQIDIIQSALTQLASNVSSTSSAGAAGKASAAGSMEALFGQIQGVSNQIQGLIGKGQAGINLQKLYQVSAGRQQDIDYLKNKTQELKTVVDMSQSMIDNVANKPVVQEVYEYSK
jgi:hypothetical protein